MPGRVAGFGWLSARYGKTLARSDSWRARGKGSFVASVGSEGTGGVTLDYAARRSYRWWRPPTSGIWIMMWPKAGRAIGLVSGVFLSNER